MFGQVAAVASGALPLFWLARKKVSAQFGLIVSILYLVYPALLWATLFDVHAVVLVTPLVLWLWWMVEQRRWRWAVALLVLALLGKEEVGLVMALNGFYWLWKKPTRRFGYLAVVLGLGWSLLMIGRVIPDARHMPGHFALGYYAAYGSTTGQVAQTVLTKPWIIVRDMLQPSVLHYYADLVLPLGGISLLGLPIFLIALPELAINTLSNNDNLRTIFFQYTSVITPYVFLSAVFGWAWWKRWVTKRRAARWSPSRERWLLIGMIGLSLTFVWRWSPLPGTRNAHDALQIFTSSPYRTDINAIQRLVKPADTLAVTNNIAPQFTERDSIWAFPEHLDQADGIIALVGGIYEYASPDQMAQTIIQLKSDPAWTLAYHHQDLYYFRRTVQP